jgi:tetratricopeptide (TPR) repeat protein
MDTLLPAIAALLSIVASTYAQEVGQPARAPTFEDLSQQAEAARDAKRLDEALTLYKRALELKPGWEDGWWNAGSIAYDLNNYTECVSDFHRMAELKPASAPGWTMEGICEYQLRDYKAALRSLTRAEKVRFEENPELSRAGGLHLAIVLTKFGYFEKALLLLTDVTAIEQKTPEIIAAAGIAGLRKRWVPPEVPKSDQDKVFKLGDAMASALSRDYDGAVEKFELALRDYPQEPEIHYRFGAYLTTHDPDRGIQELKKTLDLDPGHVPSTFGLARIYLKRGEPEAALPYARKAVKLRPEDSTAHLALGQALLATGDPTGAARELKSSAKLDPKSPTPHWILAEAYAKLGHRADAAREREEAKRLRESPPSGP